MQIFSNRTFRLKLAPAFSNLNSTGQKTKKVQLHTLWVPVTTSGASGPLMMKLQRIEIICEAIRGISTVSLIRFASEIPQCELKT